MKRSALLRRTPLRRSNAKRRAKAYARNYGERGQAVRDMPCILAGHVRFAVAEHAHTGKTWIHEVQPDAEVCDPFDPVAVGILSALTGNLGVDVTDAAAAAHSLLRSGRAELPGGPSLTLIRQSCVGRIQAAHARARGMGGANGDRRDLFPACAFHHDAQGRLGLRRFAEIFGVDPISEAARIAGELDERGIS